MRHCLLFFILVITSCSYNENELLLSYNSSNLEAEEYAKMINKHEETRLKLKQRKNHNMLLSQFIKLENNSYVLQITELEAIELGISSENYVLAKEEIVNVNNYIKDVISSGGHINLFDVQKRANEYYQGINTFPTEILNSSNTLSRSVTECGTIYTLGNEPNETSSRAYGTKVRFCCRSAAAILPYYTCSVRINGAVNTEIVTGSSFCNRVVYVNIPGSLSGDYGKIVFSTSDSHGGSCYWEVH